MSSQLLKTASPLLFLFVVFASAQVYDLGPHNIDDHGCLGCHVLHVPAANIETSDADVLTLWGKELNHLSYNAGGSEIGISETQINVPQDPIFHTTVCLACHDASIAKLGMVGSAFDTVGPIGPSFQEDGMFARTFTVHPVHVPYLPNTGCGVPTSSCNPNHWPSLTDANGMLNWTLDAYSTRFGEIYPRGVRFYPTSNNGGKAMVECASCHDPHAQGYTEKKDVKGRTVLVRSKSFVRGWYDVDDRKNDPVSKFCRSCHYASSNEFVEKKS
jgi:hypothetical protein